ncbi:MAG TPA: penicillin acylase family protein [Candidatus Acidoferrales bacterium]|nr:penicillin acylase family protein [Candidatus Acidoferrales bacterium]
MTQFAVGRIVKIVNIAIAALLAIALAAVYWFIWRPLPQRSGAIDAPLGAGASVSFDTIGEPHIRAATLEDALFVQGYVTAQDRLWQMDALRRFAAGDLAEILGLPGLEPDRDARRLRLRRIAEEGYGTLPADDRAALAAYTRGVNHFISTHLHNLPIEFTLLNYQPRPWSVVDSLLLYIHMFRSLTTTWKDEATKQNMLAQGDRQKVDFLFPMYGLADGNPGSNAWAIAGSHTASGKPILSNDMHLEYSLPGIWYMVHIQAPGLDVAGVTIPGAPGVVVGHNRRIAWGITNLQFDVQDLYLEKFDDRTGQYVFRGQTEQARQEREIIRVKGQPSVEMDLWVTRHGPLMIHEGQSHLALRWAVAEPGLLQFAFLDIDRAQNWQEFRKALSRYPGPGSNLVYADIDGNIGYQAVGRLPKRHNYRGDVPVDGSSGEFEWDGFIPFDELPSVFNPPSGIIASANQNTFPPNYPYPVNGNFAPPYRFRQIRDLLGSRNGWRAADMLTVQKDIYSAFHKFLAGQVVAAYDRRNSRSPDLDDAVELLRRWNGQMHKDQAEPFLITLVYQHVRSSIAANAAPSSTVVYEFNMAPVVVQRLLTERPAGWFRDYDEMLLRALLDALEEGRRIQGSDVKRWQYGAWLRIAITNPVVHQVPVLGKYFDIGPVPMSGANTTVKQTTRVLAPSMRMSADLADWDRSLLNIPIGQSGQILSSHYKDEWDAYYNSRSYPMQFLNVQATSTLEFRPVAQ